MRRSIGTAIVEASPAHRLLLAVLLATALAVAVSWVGTLASVDTGLTASIGHGSVASDLRTFVTAGRLVAGGEEASLYDPAQFEAEGVNAYLNPPFFAILFIPLIGLPVWSAWVLWSAISVACLVGALHLLGVRRPFVVACAAALTYPVFLGLKLGQAATVGLLLLAACHRFLGTGRSRAAGVSAGLLVYKPWLLAATVLWWLVDHRRRRAALLTALVTACGLVAISALVMPGAWAAYPERLAGAATEYAAAPVFEYTAWHSVRQLAPAAPAPVVAAVAIAVSAAVLAGYLWFLRRAADHGDACFAASVIAGLLLAPHEFPYDWVLLIVPAVLLARSFPAVRDVLVGCGAALAVVSIVSWPLGVHLWGEFGRSVPIGYPALLVSAVVVARRVLRELAASGDRAATAPQPSGQTATRTPQAGGAASR